MPKERATITVRIDSNVWAWYAAQGHDYKRRMNMVLRRYSKGQRAASGDYEEVIILWGAE
uniref:BrnA antitoxin of type II toxin-antitoxin system n=1 Tax=Candidatus Kentrum sp. DK TaxID=2126562 RepID=A0A450SCB2_9GAMM|nr:MAG: BrnA antitoxin of type II toxin-antitoxin system [Candidatus Kentron sp. DK]